MKARFLQPLPGTETEAEAQYIWHIERWPQLDRKVHGPIFECAGSPFRVLFFPFGNNVEQASFYLEHGFEKDPPENWYACVQFLLVLWNPNDPSIWQWHAANHRFTAKEGDWGFTRFVELRKAFQQNWDGHERSLIENNEANLTIYVRILKDPTGVLWHNFENYDSKEMTGMVGLKNQGATCYLNSLLQSLYFTNAFRKAVYQIPTDEDATKNNSAWTLQRLFYNLQNHKLAVSTSELTASFGWDSRQIFEQQDVQELSRILMEKLEERMKNTEAEHALANLFVGKSKTYISCINVDFESSRIEDYWDIQLNVRGNKTLHDSFMDYIQEETLDGENKYDAGEPYKLQDAKKGVIFESFPPVLHLQLKRFEYDINRDAMMKVNDRHEFPDEFDAAPYLSKDADKSESWMYELHGVLVHSGDIGAGHYYAFLKPNADGIFYKYDDDRVTKCTMNEVLEENYGGDIPQINGRPDRQSFAKTYAKRANNAYMLVYLRKSRLDKILCPVEVADIPSHIERKIIEERAELDRKRKEREEQHLYINVHVMSDLTFKEHQTFDLVSTEPQANDPAAAKVHRIRRSMRLSEFAITVGQELGVSGDQVRFWVIVGRQNKTNRPDQPLRDINMTMEEASNRYGTKGSPFRVYAETCELSDKGQPLWPDLLPNASANPPILVFLKCFDVHSQTLSGVSHMYVGKNSKVRDIGEQVLQIMRWEPGTSFQVFEEIKQAMIEQMKLQNTFGQSEIQDGDIICVQQTVPEAEVASYIYTDARQYYDYLLNRMAVQFMDRMADGDDGTFTLMLSQKMTYEQWTAKVGEQLKVDPTHLRFATVHLTTGKAKAYVKRAPTQTLRQTLSAQYSSYGYSQQRGDALYYEVLETSLADFETKKTVRVNWLVDGITKEESVDVLVSKTGKIADLLVGLKKKLNLDDETMNVVRFYEASGGKVYKELQDESDIRSITEYADLYAEKTPEEELDAGPNDKIVYCYHFDKEPSKQHGTPFKFVVKPDEVFKDTRERLSKRTGIKGKLLEKIKFAIVNGNNTYSKPRYLQDGKHKFLCFEFMLTYPQMTFLLTYSRIKATY